MTVQELYNRDIRQLPAADRLRLASLILDDLASVAGGVDFGDHWTDEDAADLAAHAMRHAEESVPSKDHDG